jgi:hypothetical protein
MAIAMFNFSNCPKISTVGALLSLQTSGGIVKILQK